MFAMEMRPASGWLGMLLSGLASIALAIIIASGWPGISLIVLGLLFGINFLTTGLGYIFISRAFKP
jgi:membrane protein HdeD